MRCKSHVTDTSSGVGVCASCLRQKLLPILAAQSHHQSPPSILKNFSTTPQLAPKREKVSRFPLLPNPFRSRLKKTDATSSPPESWISNIFSARRKENSVGGGDCRRKVSGRGRGMSPARSSDCEGGGGCSSEEWRQTPRRDVRKHRRGLGSGDVAGFTFCLSPLVRASPKKGWKSKSMPSDVAAFASVKPQLATAATLCANRSRKIADFGRLDHRRQ